MRVFPNVVIAMALLSAGCAATPPFDKTTLIQVDRGVSYTQAAQEPELVAKRQVLFGGTIVSLRNLPQSSELVILAFPLNDSERPDTSVAPLGRLIVTQPGYLEGTTYGTGRLLSIRGVLDGVRTEPLGETSYRYPVLQAVQLHLWPDDPTRRPYPRFNIGIGVFGGNVGGSVGIPIP
jgi:outer membrane lipoprotein